MTVAELRTILEHLPDDLPVVAGRGEVWSVTRYCAPGKPSAVVLGVGMVALRVVPAVQLRGQFLRAAELDRRLDALSPIGGPTT